MVRKAVRVNQGDLLTEKRRSSWMRNPEEPQGAGVRALIVAKKSRNGDGAKGRREVDW
jgi:hypothetical protein